MQVARQAFASSRPSLKETFLPYFHTHTHTHANTNLWMTRLWRFSAKAGQVRREGCTGFILGHGEERVRDERRGQEEATKQPTANAC